MYKGLNEAVLELGDVENWIRSIDRDISIITQTIDHVTQQSRSQPRR